MGDSVREGQSGIWSAGRAGFHQDFSTGSFWTTGSEILKGLRSSSSSQVSAFWFRETGGETLVLGVTAGQNSLLCGPQLHDLMVLSC